VEDFLWLLELDALKTTAQDSAHAAITFVIASVVTKGVSMAFSIYVFSGMMPPG
jgi:hypothetical protein